MAIYARSNSLILSISPDNVYRESFAFRPMPRSSEPEIFTFDPVPIRGTQRSAPVRQRKKNTRVMYPSKVRKYLPPAEKSPVKRWLVILCLVVCLQIYTEEAHSEAPAVADSPAPDAPKEDLSFAQYDMLPFQSAEQQVRQMKGEAHRDCPLHVVNTTCADRDSEGSDLQEPSRRNGYVVALLYPVYHRLGSDK